MSRSMFALTSSGEERDEVQSHPYRDEIRLLFLVAACVFTVTVLIGMLNGQHVVQLSLDVLLTHVHAGTLGWITLGVFALSLWLFGSGDPQPQDQQYVRWLSILAAAAIPIYVAAFLSGNFLARALFGVPVLVAIVGLLVWVVRRAARSPLTLTRVALLGAIVTLVLGGLLGVLLQIEIASNAMFLPEGAFAAHPSALVTGYLVLIGMAISEWRLRPTTRPGSHLGTVQIACFFASGLLIAVAFLFNLVPLLGLNTLLLLVGVLIYIRRFAGRVTRTAWQSRTSARFFAASGVFIVVNTALTIFVAVGLVTGMFAPDALPGGILLALDHTMFIGVMTNALIGLVLEVAADRQVSWPWAQDAVFWGMNIGLAGFATALITGADLLVRLSTPVMGLGILLFIVVYVPLLFRRSATVAVGTAN